MKPVRVVDGTVGVQAVPGANPIQLMSDPPTSTLLPKPGFAGATLNGSNPIDDGKCELFGPPALIVQGLMGVMVILTLVYKRHREKPKRKWRIWAFDVSKQLVGQLVVHFANVFISDLVADHTVQNPCVLYFLNIVVDTTVGVGIIYLLLYGSTKILTEQFHIHGLQSGQYGDGPKPSIRFWARQAAVYVACLLGMKIAVVILFAVWPGIFSIGEWLLSWTGNSDLVQVVVVMGVCPIIFNMLQFWLIDSIVKAKDALNLGSPDPNIADEAQEPLFADGNDSDDNGNVTSHSRRRSSRDLERGVSPLKLSPSSPTREYNEPKPSSTMQPKTTTNVAGPSALPSHQAIKRGSPPPSPAQGPTTSNVPKADDDDWNSWDDDADWGGEAAGTADPWSSQPGSRTRTKSATSRSPKAGSGRLSLQRHRSEGNERTAWGMDVIHTPGGPT